MPAATAVQQLSIPVDIQQQLAERVSDLNMVPAVALEAVEMTKNPECTIRDVAAIVERDPVLAADVIAIANSALYTMGGPILGVTPALNRLGLRLSRSHILASGMIAMVRQVPLEEEWTREVLCRHGFITALSAVSLNRVFNTGFQGEEFTAGLMHDIGRTLLAVCLPERFSDVDQLDFQEGPELLVRERAVLGTDHCEIGAWFAAHHRLPGPLSDVIRWHHLPQQSTTNQRLVALIATCDHLANHIQQFESSDNYDPAANAAVPLLEACGVSGATARFAEHFSAAAKQAALEAARMLAP